MFISKDTLARAGAPGTSTPNSGLAFSLLPALLLASCGGGSSGSSSTSTPTPDETPSGPTISITSQPANGTQDPYGRIAFEAAGAARFTCAIDGGVAAECSSPFLAYPLEPGDHVVRVVAYDAAGNAGEAANAAWTVSSIFGDAANGALHPDLIPTAVQPAPVAPNSWKGILRINCDFSHSSYNDPIVYPDQPDAAHLHRFYGNMDLDETSTTESLFTAGQSTCQGNTLNRSAYWIPALLAPAYEPGTAVRQRDADGEPAWKVVPAVVGGDEDAHEIFYYSAGVSDLASIQPIPLGLKMIAGNHMGQPGMEQDTSIVRWHCQSWASDEATNPRWSTSIPECAAPDRLRMDIFFPSCWNGTDLDSADHKSHLAYPVEQSGRQVCPSSHPVPIIRVSFHYAWGVLPDVYDPATLSSRGWRLASDGYEASVSTPGGMSLHGDWFNAWHPEALEAVLEHCIKGGLDCHDGNLANGYRLSGVQPGSQDEPEIVNAGRGY